MKLYAIKNAYPEFRNLLFPIVKEIEINDNIKAAQWHENHCKFLKTTPKFR